MSTQAAAFNSISLTLAVTASPCYLAIISPPFNYQCCTHKQTHINTSMCYLDVHILFGCYLSPF